MRRAVGVLSLVLCVVALGSAYVLPSDVSEHREYEDGWAFRGLVSVTGIWFVLSAVNKVLMIAKKKSAVMSGLAVLAWIVMASAFLNLLRQIGLPYPELSDVLREPDLLLALLWFLLWLLVDLVDIVFTVIPPEGPGEAAYVPRVEL